jgi:hypothetical protein
MPIGAKISLEKARQGALPLDPSKGGAFAIPYFLGCGSSLEIMFAFIVAVVP